MAVGGVQVQDTATASIRTAFALGGPFLSLGGYFVGARSNNVSVLQSSNGGDRECISIPISVATATGIRHARGHFGGDRGAQGVICWGAVATALEQAEAHGFKFSSPWYAHPSLLFEPNAADGSWPPHSVVVYPTSTEGVIKTVGVVRKSRMPGVPYSGAMNHFRAYVFTFVLRPS